MTGVVPVIIQARTSSARLPSKIMLPWGHETLLGRVIRECKHAGQPVWVATSTDPSDDVVVSESYGYAARVYRGPLDDVLARFVGCIEAMPVFPDAVVRVCADRPFINADLIRAAIRYWNQADDLWYLRFGEGSLTVEVVSAHGLQVTQRFNPNEYEREHVTAWLAKHGGRKAHVRGSTVDTYADYQALRP